MCWLIYYQGPNAMVTTTNHNIIHDNTGITLGISLYDDTHVDIHV